MTAFRLAFLFLVSFFCSIAASQTQPLLYSYRAFSVVDQPNLEQTLSRNGAQGFRLVALSKRLNGDLVAVMEKAQLQEATSTKRQAPRASHLSAGKANPSSSRTGSRGADD